jgi:2'-5' RNA ligase
MTGHRVFFALWPDSKGMEHLAALTENLLAGNAARRVPAQNLHLTLAFVGTVTSGRIRQLEDIAAGVEENAFDFTLDRLGFWPQRGILWAGCRQPPLELPRLMTALREKLSAAGFMGAMGTEGPGAVAPHLTLARGVRCASLPRLGSPIGFPVREFSLVESHRSARGSRYETLASFPLGTAD